VSKDINMRIKARALGIAAEDYFNDKVLEDTDLLYSGMRELPGDFWDKHGKAMESWQQGGYTYYRITGPLVAFAARQRVPLSGEARRAASVRPRQGDHRTHRGAADAQGLHAPEEQRLGHHGAQPGAEFRAQPPHEPRTSTSFRCWARQGTGKTLLTLAAGSC
jgi:PhoH-like ATPase